MNAEEIKQLEEEFYKKFPETYKEFVCTVRYDEDPVCVIDEGRRDDCVYGWEYIKKEKCPYWVERKRDSFLLAEDVWRWLEKKAEKQ